MSRSSRLSTPSIAQAPRRALTLVELLVALTIAGIFFSSVIAAFVMILRSSHAVEVETDAVSNARAALENLSVDLKQADHLSAGWRFVGVDVPTLYGKDANADKEQPDGQNDNGGTFDKTQTYALLTEGWTTLTLHERPAQYADAAPHFGDVGVDEDTFFHHDTLEFLVHAPGKDPYFVRYEIQTFDGAANVLTRTVSDLALTTSTVSPVAYDVLSFNGLYWDASLSVPDWVESWNDSGAGGSIPPSVLVQVTVYADPKPIETYRLGDAVQTVLLSTIVNPAPPLPPDVYGAVAHWRFDETAGTTVYDSAGGHTATLTGATPAQAWVTGHIGGAVRLQGAGQYVATNSLADYLRGSSDFTVAVWMNPDAGNQPRTTLFAAGNPPLTGGIGASRVLIRRPEFPMSPEDWTWIFSPVGGSGFYLLSPSTVVLPGTWHHFVAVKRGTVTSTYLDGVLSAQIDIGSELSTETGSWRVFFGDMPDPLVHWPYSGLIDDVRIYNRALTVGEIGTLAAQ